MNKQKIIDVHTHLFPELIRQKAVASIGGYYDLAMHGTGEVEDLIGHGSPCNVVKYVVHSAATRAEQVQTINQFIKALQDNDDKLIGFGTIHQRTKNPREVVDEIIDMGLNGIKLHPDFQRFYIDNPKMFPIYEAMEGRLPLMIHMGDENSDASSPARLLNVIKRFPSLTVIAPHLGGYTMWDEAMETIVGQNIYLDTSSSLAFLPKEKAVDIIRAHGSDKVLFGTDYPMWLHEDELERFFALGLSDEENEKILYCNAAKLFGIQE